MTTRSSGVAGRGLAIGLTGGIGCGKSEVGRILAAEGVPVLDTDEVARGVLAKGRPVFEQVIARFGRNFLTTDGEIDRRQLGDRVFARKDDREALNRLVHPPVLDAVRVWLRNVTDSRKAAVVTVPLLYEIEFTDLWRAVICVAADEPRIVARLKSRGWSEVEIRNRIASQMPLDEKIRRADFVIYNNGSLDDLRVETQKTWTAILNTLKKE